LRFVWKFDLSDVRLPGAEKRRAFLLPIIFVSDHRTFPIIGLRPPDKHFLQRVRRGMWRRDAALEPAGATPALLLLGITLVL